MLPYKFDYATISKKNAIPIFIDIKFPTANLLDI